jgi:hypothetical protein
MLVSGHEPLADTDVRRRSNQPKGHYMQEYRKPSAWHMFRSWWQTPAQAMAYAERRGLDPVRQAYGKFIADQDARRVAWRKGQDQNDLRYHALYPS